MCYVNDENTPYEDWDLLLGLNADDIIDMIYDVDNDVFIDMMSNEMDM